MYATGFEDAHSSKSFSLHDFVLLCVSGADNTACGSRAEWCAVVASAHATTGVGSGALEP